MTWQELEKDSQTLSKVAKHYQRSQGLPRAVELLLFLMVVNTWHKHEPEKHHQMQGTTQH
jgi:hypothetical protein